MNRHVFFVVLAMLPAVAFGAVENWAFPQNELLHTIALVAFFFAGFHNGFKP